MRKLLFTTALALTASAFVLPIPSANAQSARDFVKSGVTKGRKGDFDGAISDYNKALRIDPENGVLFWSRASAKTRLDNREGACSDYKLAKKFGVVNFRRVRALDTYPLFIQGLADLISASLKGPEVSLDEVSSLPSGVKLYPQEKWQWGWNNSAEAWNGRIAMFGFLGFLLELIVGKGPLHSIGLLTSPR